MFKIKILSYHEVQKNTKKAWWTLFFAIIWLVLQITEHLKRNVQTSIVPFQQNLLMQHYWNIYASIVKVGI